MRSNFNQLLVWLAFIDLNYVIIGKNLVTKTYEYEIKDEDAFFYEFFKTKECQ